MLKNNFFGPKYAPSIEQCSTQNLFQLLVFKFTVNILLLGAMQSQHSVPKSSKTWSKLSSEGILEEGFLCSELNFLFLSQHIVQLPNRHPLGELLPAT